MDTDGYGYGPRYGYYGRRVYYGYGAPAITVAGITATGIIGDRCVDGSGDRSEPSRRFMHGVDGAALRHRTFNREGAGGRIFVTNGLGVHAAW
jgi:hypothetical protein